MKNQSSGEVYVGTVISACNATILEIKRWRRNSNELFIEKIQNQLDHTLARWFLRKFWRGCRPISRMQAIDFIFKKQKEQSSMRDLFFYGQYPDTGTGEGKLKTCIKILNLCGATKSTTINMTAEDWDVIR